MTFGRLALKNLGRSKLRLALTALGVAVAVMAFLLLRTVLWAWSTASEYAVQDRIATRHKVSYTLPIPKHYVQAIRDHVPEVQKVSSGTVFGGKDPRHPDLFFPSLGVDPHTWFDVLDEMAIPPAELAAWKADSQGAIVGDALAHKLGLKVGDTITLAGTMYPGDWSFHVAGIYTATRKSVDRMRFFFHWDYLNRSQDLPDERRDQVEWIVSRIDDAGLSAKVSQKIDALFDSRDVQTTTMSEKAVNNSFLSMFSSVLTAMDVVSLVVLVIMTLILGNTIAMGVRERTSEYAVLRAIGFLPRHVLGFVLCEGVLVGFLGGALGLVLGYPLIQSVLGRWLEANVGQFFPYFRIPAPMAASAVALAMILGGLAALWPAVGAARLPVANALRRVE